MRPPLLFGHRGARGLFPENTLEGFAAVQALGVDGVELDVAITADGVPVVTHDPALNPALVRTEDGIWITRRGPLIRELSLAELATYDVGRARPGGVVAIANPDQTPCDGARIPTLAQALTVLATRIIVELKTMPDHPDWTVAATIMADAAAAVADCVEATGRIVVESFDWRGPRHLRRTRPDIRLAWLTSAEITAAARLWWDGPTPQDFGGSVPRAVAADAGSGGIWAPEHVDLTPDLIAEAHDLGLSVIPWTVNRRQDIGRLIGWNIDGLITDRPDLARQVMADAGLVLPPVPPRRDR